MQKQVKNVTGVYKQTEGSPDYERMSQRAEHFADKAFPGTPGNPTKMTMPPCQDRSEQVADVDD